MNSPIIIDIQSGTERLPLIRPYKLSFVTLKEITSVWIRISDESGRIGYGEGVPLPGYSDETETVITNGLKTIVKRYTGKPLHTVRTALLSEKKQPPFVVSAAMSAIDILESTITQPIRFPLVYPLAATNKLASLDKEISIALNAGFRHLKIKVGRNIDEDIATRRHVEGKFLTEIATIRYDANQAYSYQQSCEFCTAAPLSSGVLWLEQPFTNHDWDQMKRLSTAINFPLMLDESIYEKEDILRAKNIGCAAVKLKLAKHPGINACKELVRYSHSLGLKTTIGNGVSSDIGNMGEALVAHACQDKLTPGLECNGFAKLKKYISYNLRVDHGNLYYNPNHS